MSANFRRVASEELGYSPLEVDRVVALARQQFAEPTSRVIDASGLRSSQFELSKGGYEVAAVDAALDRLDDAFAQNEIKRLISQSGHEGAREHVAKLKALLLNRIERASAHRFKRNHLFGKGYSKRQVDAVLNLINEAIQGTDGLAVSYLRQVAFSPRWGGYHENQVDAFIDKTVEFLQLNKAVL